VRQGDVIYYPDRERHYLEAAADEELVSRNSSRRPNSDRLGRRVPGLHLAANRARHRRRLPAREIKAHSSAEVLSRGCVIERPPR